LGPKKTARAPRGASPHGTGPLLQAQRYEIENMPRTTILDAVVEALPRDGVPRSAQVIHQFIVDRSLFTFRAQDPLGILRSALRKHLAAHGGQGQPPARIRQIERDRYVAM
jgi:hypothetical protein